MPTSQANDYAFPGPNPQVTLQQTGRGITIREYIATAALQGILAGEDVVGASRYRAEQIKLAADNAVKCADALIEALSESPS
jgi:hypothetical protein